VLDVETLDSMRRHLFPLARVVVARATDAARLAGAPAEGLEGMHAAAGLLRSQGARSVLIAGGAGKDRVLDVLDEAGDVSVLDASRVLAPHLAGLGGAHAAALTGHLARGLPLPRAVMAAQRYVALRLQRGR
jgi:hydroxymethylpyrimidine/phosphomethylpyrimidine kinase